MRLLSCSTRGRGLVLGGLISLGTVLTAGGIGHAQEFSLTDLGTLGGPQSTAYGINNSGQVVGNVNTSATTGAAFLYSNGTMTDLGIGSGSTATGINGVGQVVGYMANGDPYLYSNGAITDLGSFGGPGGAAYGINNTGQIVGSAYPSSGYYHAFLYSNGTMMDLSYAISLNSDLVGPGPGLSLARGINDFGQVVGWATRGSYGDMAFLYSNGVAAALGTLGGSTSNAMGINNLGQVVGSAATAGDTYAHAFLFSNGTMTDLGTLGGHTSWANGINNLGYVVGNAATGDSQHAFLYRNGSMLDLNSLLLNRNGWTLLEATAINDNDQIVGYGLDALGQQHAFLLTPVPLPAAALLFPSGLGVLALAWRKRSSKGTAGANQKMVP